jgi:hypothetical protein
MDRRPPIQLRGSAGFAPASRTPDVRLACTRLTVGSQIAVGLSHEIAPVSIAAAQRHRLDYSGYKRPFFDDFVLIC